ncbi:MAG: 4-(cytidine 5'-diphospho)-2-C-methyl-D-erythritol kinase [Planctomycetota bacterium]|nr:4-(cytidine 5'-diphospho)-2-C-methyl-D-erythritol kinase [Planctomycetota bacterium]
MTSSTDGVAVDAPAKVNLTLRVVGKRTDGYHDLESVVAAVGVFDRLDFEPADELLLTCDDPALPSGDDNLVMKAARLFQKFCGTDRGARVFLKKRIPAGRGFGGGSSDAAACLAGLNALWQCGKSLSELAALGAQLGSDVPLFFGPPVAVMRGRGERLEPVPARPTWHAALVWPKYGNPTAEVYVAYDRDPPAANGRPGATEILKVMGGSACEAAPFLINDLEPAARSLRSDGVSVRTLLETAGATAVGMTGSGSAYFALTDTEAEARRLVGAARAGGAEAVAAALG